MPAAGSAGEADLEPQMDENLPAVQIGRKHFPGAIHQVVGFIHEKTVITSVFGEMPAQNVVVTIKTPEWSEVLGTKVSSG